MTIALVFTILLIIIGAIFSLFLAKYKFQSQKFSQEILNLFNEKQNLQNENLQLINKNFSLEKENILMKQEKEIFNKQLIDWKADKETILLELSEKLLKRNQEQQNQISQNQQENIKKITENLFKNFEEVTAKMVSLDDQVKESSKIANLTKQALLNPGSAGKTAEITLENILKSSGLKEKENIKSVGDYLLQSHFTSTSQSNNFESSRPDAILFFPNDQIIIIDSKSSSHFLELEEAIQKEDFAQEKIILSKIKESFRRHLESLKKKDYAKSLFEDLINKESKDCVIFVIMFLQTEKMLEILRKNDPDFEQKALENNIIVSSPIGLINLLSQARMVIDRNKQQKNIEALKISINRLVDNLSVVFKDSAELGKSLNKALKTHNKIVKSLNSRVSPAIKNINELGIESKKSKNIETLEEYAVEDEENEGN